MNRASARRNRRGAMRIQPLSAAKKDLMKSSALLTQAKRLSVLSLGAGVIFSLAGCETLNDWLAPDRVNYKAAETAPALNVPSDLSTADISQRYAAPPPINTLGGATQRNATP